MKTPKLLAIPFAQNGNKNIIYEERQASQEPNEATYNTGFPPITMQPKEDGGLPPLGLDFNGIFFEESAHTVYLCMGGQYYFDAEYAEKINGYPKGAILLNEDNNKRYISNTNNNKVNFNTEDPAKLTDWSVIAIAEIDKLLAGKIDNVDFSNALNLKADTSTKLTAGNGLSGGGDLTTSRTITLGTPSTITENSKNTVTTTSHTHEIQKATTSQSGIVQLTSALSNEEDKAATPKAVNDVNIVATNAQKSANAANDKANQAKQEAYEADQKAVAAQTKANQVPNPIKDQFLIGNTATGYKLITKEELIQLLAIPSAVKVVNETGDSTTSAISQKAFTDLSLGIEQKWVNVTSQRAKGTTYTNDTDKPIFISVTGRETTLSLDINDERIVTGGGSSNYISAIIQQGERYKITASGNFEGWGELR